MNNYKPLLIVLILMTGCQKVPFNGCPTLRDYTRAFQIEAFLEPKGERTKEMLDDYVALRDQVRACQ